MSSPMKLRLATVFVALFALFACTSESYDAGDGANSYVTADFALLATSSDRTIHSAQLDDDTSVRFSNPFTLDWAQKPDSVYRVVLYYDKRTAEQTLSTVKARSVVPVHVLTPLAENKVKQMRTDPVGFESVWLSKNATYINMSLLMKSGKAEDDNAAHTIGFVNRGMTADADGRHVLHLEFYHDQGDVPEYYTVQRYISIDTHLLGGADAVELTVNTYKGLKTVLVNTSYIVP